MSTENLPLPPQFPNKLPIIGISGKPLFPGIITPIMLTNSFDIKLAEDAIAGDGFLGLVLSTNPEVEMPNASELHKVGTLARILKKINLPDGGVNLIITTIQRFIIRKTLNSKDPVVLVVEYPEETSTDTLEIKALTRSLLTEMKQISENNPLISEEMRLNMVNIDHPGKIADFIAGILNIDRKEQQKILENFDIATRMREVLVFIKKEHELLKIQKKIQGQINEKIEKSQRDYFLREQLKLIKEELGIAKDAQSSDSMSFSEKLLKMELEDQTREAISKEIEKFGLMETNSSEYHVTRNYLETIFSLPWGSSKRKEIDAQKALKILNEDHYGLEDVKDRIMEFIAIGKKRGSFRGSIICLVGPPGVGKTSIGRSIAHALKRDFFRFSVGGMRDEAEIKGHRRTYIGAMPGKIIQGLKTTKTKQMVFMIDEIDKMGQSYQGDPSSALLEVLDPEQNTSFRDHYLDLPFDISEILFITTANTLESIPLPLIDRMEIIRISGYTSAEKIQIAKKYLLPKSLEVHGFEKRSVNMVKEALSAIAETYCREAGVRSFSKKIDRMLRKIARDELENKIKLPITIDEKDLVDYLGKPFFVQERRDLKMDPGIVTGLAWTSLGGDTLQLETIALPGKEGLILTGQMGNVMQESARIALSYVRSIAQEFSIASDFFEKNTIHLHIPQGSTPKDGPSAGITMATCFLSLATGRSVKKKFAMTGELSLSGKVHAIGGLKEKSLAAQRAGITHVIIPEANTRDLDEIPDHVKKDIIFHPVTNVKEVFQLVL